MPVYTEEQLAKVPCANFSKANAKPGDIEFFLYKNAHQFEEIHLDSCDKITKEINPSLPTKVISHGFTTNRSSPWYQTIKSAYFAKDPQINIILIDWSKAGDLSFGESSANVLPVGGFLADFLLQTQVPLDKIHLIGYSLGAQLVGFAGKEISRKTNGKKVGRITGLDPAGPGFERAGPEARLCDNDAEFVDVVHSDIGYYGIVKPIGHVDFYINGGKNQPGCPSREEDENCSHRRAVLTFIESITNENVYAVEGVFVKGENRVAQVPKGEKVIFGEAAKRNLRGIYFLESTATAPYLKSTSLNSVKIDVI